MKLSVIIPVYHEKDTIGPCLERLLVAGQDIEIIVVDGAPEGDTLVAVQEWMKKSEIKIAYDDSSLLLKQASSGRAVQMNCGALCASGDVVLFLHVDTILPDNYFKLLEKAFYDGQQVGAFSLRINDERPWFRVVEYLANKRNTWTKTPYGDQAQFFSASFFKELGGYTEIPLMEDVDIMRRVRDAHVPLCILKECVVTSARRWHDEGLLYCSLRNVALRTLYAFGVTPAKLAKWYAFEKQCRKGRARD